MTSREHQAVAKHICVELGEVLRETISALDQLRAFMKGQPDDAGSPK